VRMATKVKYLLTGATGFLGSHVIQLLLQRGFGVRALVRSEDERLRSLGVELVFGSVGDAEIVMQAASGVNGIFHFAGVVVHSRNQQHVTEMLETNIEGTINVIKAAIKNKCRVVYASTSGTVGCTETGTPIPNDSFPYCKKLVQHWPYYSSKILAEIKAKELVAASLAEGNEDFELIILRPSMMLGPGDERYRSTRTVLSFIERKVPIIPPGGVSFVDVRDVSEIAICVMQKNFSADNSFRQTNVRCYLLGAANWTMQELFVALEKTSGVPGPRFGKLPRFLTSGVAFMADHCPSMFHFDPVQVEMSSRYWWIDCSKAKEELDFTPRDPIATIADTVRWIYDSKIKLPHCAISIATQPTIRSRL